MDPQHVFQAYGQTQDAALTNAMNAVIAAEFAYLRPLIMGGFTLFVAVCGMLVATSNMSFQRAINYASRAVIIATLLQAAASYNTYIRDTFFTTIPGMIATAVTGSPTPITAAQQFDQLSNASEKFAADALGQATGFTMIGDRIAIWMTNQGIQAVLAIEFIVVLLGRALLAIVLCFGPFLLIFELFENTRGYVRSWIGKLVGLSVFQLASAIMLTINGQGARSIITAMEATAGQGLAQRIGFLDHLFLWFFLDAMALLALPSICAIGSGIAAGTAVAPTAMLAVGRSGTRAVVRAIGDLGRRTRP